MKQMLQKFNPVPSFRNTCIGLTGFVAANSAFAAVDTAAVETAIDNSVGDAETVGGYVVAAVAALVVIGLIIGIIRKI